MSNFSDFIKAERAAARESTELEEKVKKAVETRAAHITVLKEGRKEDMMHYAMAMRSAEAEAVHALKNYIEAAGVRMAEGGIQ